MPKMKADLKAVYADHVHSYEYPGLDHALEAGKVVLAKVRGETVERNCLIHCGFVVQGFALSKAFPLPDVDNGDEWDRPDGMKSRATDEDKFSKKKGEKALEAFVEKGSEGMGATESEDGVGAINWMQIALLVAELIKQWRSGK